MNTMPVIEVLALGGTIAMTPDASSGVTPSLGADALVSAVPSLKDIASIKAETLATVGSPNISFQMVADLCARAEASKADAIVVTQGTDTLEETSFLASLVYRGSKPLVFTGAMRPATVPGADGPNNLYNSVLLAASGIAPKVSVVMNGEIHDPWHVAKEHTFAVGAFVSEHVGPLGYILEQQVRYRMKPVAVSPLPYSVDTMPDVALVTSLLEADTRLLSNIVKLGYRGLVVEAFGAGHVSEEWADSLENIARDIPVLLATRASNGPVLEKSYGYKGAEIDLISRGLVPCGALKGRKARLLLSLLLSASPENWRTCFATAVGAL